MVGPRTACGVRPVISARRRPLWKIPRRPRAHWPRGTLARSPNGELSGGSIPSADVTDNYPSLRVIARLGFRFEGIARQAEYVGGRWVDHAVFGRLSTD